MMSASSFLGPYRTYAELEEKIVNQDTRTVNLEAQIRHLRFHLATILGITLTDSPRALAEIRDLVYRALTP